SAPWAKGRRPASWQQAGLLDDVSLQPRFGRANPPAPLDELFLRLPQLPVAVVEACLAPVELALACQHEIRGELAVSQRLVLPVEFRGGGVDQDGPLVELCGARFELQPVAVEPPFAPR